MKKLESIKDDKFKKLEPSKFSNLITILGGGDCETGTGGYVDWSYNTQNGSDSCWTRELDGDTRELHPAAAPCY